MGIGPQEDLIRYVGQPSPAVMRNHYSTRLSGKSAPVLNSPMRALGTKAGSSTKPTKTAIRVSLTHSQRRSLQLEEMHSAFSRLDNDIACLESPAAPHLQAMVRTVRTLLAVMARGDSSILQDALGHLEARGPQLIGRSDYRGVFDDPGPEVVARSGALLVPVALSPRELSILRSTAAGLTNKRIAQALRITPETVKSHLKAIFIKLAVRTRSHAVSRAAAHGLL
jgi:DNA-binding CsgD family transcriptional regulator